MNFIKESNHLSGMRLVGIFLLIFSCLLIVGCSQEEPAEKEVVKTTNADEENRKAITGIIETEFNGPDKKYKELWEAAMATQTGEMNQEEYEASLETPEYKAFTKYMEDTYASYFTPNAYEAFSRTGAFYYSFSDQEYKLTTSDIKISQSEHGDTLYDFTFTVTYENEKGEISDYPFEGNAIVPEAGKVGKIDFKDTKQLLQKINNQEEPS